MSHVISVFPNINPVNFFLSSNRQKDPIVSKEGHLYSSGRAALFFGLAALDLPLGSIVLVPTYNCGVEIRSILLAGYKVKFYRPDDNLLIDIEQVRPLVSPEIRALMIIHYFGFPQPVAEIKEFCRENALILIEDCAHALYTQIDGSMAGTFGDIAAFSLRKTLALPNGGCLLVNSSNIRRPLKGKRCESFTLLKSTVRSCLNFLGSQSSTIGYVARKVINLWEAKQKDRCERRSTETFDSDGQNVTPFNDIRFGYENCISILSRKLLGKEEYSEIVSKRRCNYNILSAGIEETDNCKLFWATLPDGVCPLCCVLRLREGRDQLISKLERFGVGTYVFGRHPLNGIDYGQEKDKKSVCPWSEQLLGIPVHQRLKENELALIIDTVNRGISEL